MALIACVSTEAAQGGYVEGSFFSTSNSYGAAGSGVRGNRNYTTGYSFYPKFGAALTATGNSVIFGMAFRRSSGSSWGSGDAIFGLANPGVGNIFTLTTTTTGAVTLTGAGGTSSANNVLTTIATDWNYVEFKFTYVASTSTTVDVRINGVSVISGTISAASALTNGTMFSATGMAYMDWYCLDSTGTVNNNFLGDCRVEHLTPISEGTNTGWTNSGGASKTASVTNPGDGDTSYIGTDTAGVRQTFVLSDPVSTLGTPKGVQVISRGHGVTNGIVKIGGTVRTNSGNADSTEYVYGYNSANAYNTCRGTFENNPITGTAWTIAELQALEAGPIVLT